MRMWNLTSKKLDVLIGMGHNLQLATLCRIKGMESHNDSIMHQYITNKESCRRQLLFGDFESYICDAVSPCRCCDICAMYCEYTECGNAKKIKNYTL